MSLWWAKKEQLDPQQIALIETLDFQSNHLVTGPPGSGKTNVLLRRAQFARTQKITNVMVLSFTRSLTEFLKTGCLNANGVEIFPPSLINTVEGWIRDMYRSAGYALPETTDFHQRKIELAAGAMQFLSEIKQPVYDTLFVDEAQDLIAEEIELLKARSKRLFLVGDDKQKIYGHSEGLDALKAALPSLNHSQLAFHYRLAPEICRAADNILSADGQSLADTCHYEGPKPGRIQPQKGTRDVLLGLLIETLKGQLRLYGDTIAQGDKLGIVAPTKNDRDEITRALDGDETLESKWQVVRARSGDADDRHNPALDTSRPILVMTEQACKGLEFRALHWMFADTHDHYRTDEKYYTVITRAKTKIDLYHTGTLPSQLAKCHAESAGDIWS